MLLSLVSAFYLVVLVHGLYLILTVPTHRGRTMLVVFLGAIIVLTANYIVWDNTWLSPNGQQTVNLFTHRTLVYLLGPSLLLYLRLNVISGFQLRWVHAWHLVPYGVALLLSLLIFPVCMPEWSIHTANWWLPVDLWPTVVRTIHVLVYAIVGIRFLAFGRHFPDNPGLKPLIAALLATGAGSMLLGTGMSFLPTTFTWVKTGQTVGVVCLILMIYLLNRLLTAFNLPQSLFAFTLANDWSPAKPEPDKKYQHSVLDAHSGRALLDRLEAHLTNSRCYEDPGLTSVQLAQALDVSVNHFSQAINQVGGQTFYELINRHRVVAACQLLTDPKQQYLSVSGIGYEVGFRSKTTYYSAFRQHMGMTPNAYRKQFFLP